MDITQLLGNYAFPIVMCVTMAWYVKYTGDQNREDLLNLNAGHREAENQITEAIKNNTVVMERLCEKINGRIDSDGSDN